MKYLLYFIVILALSAMFFGIYVGVIRIGQPLPTNKFLPIAHHGILMAGSFLGTLFCLSQIIEKPKNWAYTIVIMMVLAIPLLFINEEKVVLIVLLLASFLFFAFTLLNFKDERSIARILCSAGAFFQIAAYLILLGTNSYPSAFAGWLLFFVLTLLGIYLKEEKLGKRSMVEIYFWIGLLLLSAFFYHSGLKVAMGISLVGIAQWLIRHENLSKKLQGKGEISYTGWSALLAFLWLIVTGILSVIKSGNPNHYDAVLHSFFVGTTLTFALSQVNLLFPKFKYAEVFHPTLWLGLLGLHASLFIRIYGDITQNFSLRKVGGVYNGVFILLYVVILAVMLLNIKLNEKSN